MRKRHPEAFTLIELLVTISVIGVVLSLLIPMLAEARERVDQLRCVSKIRTAGMVNTMYADDYRGVVAFGGSSPTEITTPAGETVRIGGQSGLYLGRWADLMPEYWEGDRWTEAMMCPDQPVYDPDGPVFPDGSLSDDGFWRESYFDLSAAFHLAPESLKRGVEVEAMRVAPQKLSSVAYPSSKAFLYEFLGTCIDRTSESLYWMNIGQTQRYATSVVAVDGSAFRYARRNAYEPATGVGIQYTMHGVLGRDIDQSLIGADAHFRYGQPDSWADTD